MNRFVWMLLAMTVGCDSAYSVGAGPGAARVLPATEVTLADLGAFGAVPSSFHTGGLAYDGGDRMVLAGYNGNEFEWFELDLPSQTMNRGGAYSAEYNVSITSYDGRWLVADGERSLLYDDFDALVAGVSSDHAASVGYVTRYQALGDQVYGAWHSTDEIVVRDLRSDADVDVIPLEGFDTWVWGLGVTDQFLHVIDDGRGAHNTDGVHEISRFDRATGERVSSVRLRRPGAAFFPSGLYCEE